MTDLERKGIADAIMPWMRGTMAEVRTATGIALRLADNVFGADDRDEFLKDCGVRR